MRKLDNKGLSLVELLIAIVVMVLLLSPIMLQLFQTVNLSGQAKEKQYVVDSSSEVMEYFRKYETTGLGVGDNEGVVNITSIVPSTYDPATGEGKGSNTCKIYLSDGTEAPGSPVTYHYVKYNLETIPLGKKNTSYSRYVVISDLVNQLSAKGYEIDYDNIPGTYKIDDHENIKNAGFEFRSDNTLVVTSGSDAYDDSSITAIVCKAKDASSPDPNTMPFGDIQDIDADKMAIITGDATTLDYQVETDIQGLLVQFAAKSLETGVVNSVTSIADDPQALNTFVKALVNNPESMEKARNIHICVTAGHNSDGTFALDANSKPKFYEVRCDVIYSVKFKGTPKTDEEGNVVTDGDGKPIIIPSDLKIFNNFSSNTGKLSYTVLNRKYYTTTPPNVYMIYEPLLLTTNTGAGAEIRYNLDDYLSVSTDKYTSNQGNNNSKIYLIKSTKNWQSVTGTAALTDATNSYYTRWYGHDEPVRIHVTQGVFDADNTKYYTDTQNKIDIYTNISLDATHKTQFADLSSIGTMSTDKQFGTGWVGSSPRFLMDKVTQADYDDANIKSVYSDNTATTERLFKTTVVYQNSSTGERTYITGAKGAN